eukprot:gene13331-14707_t
MNPDANYSKIRQPRECLGEATHLLAELAGNGTQLNSGDEQVVGAASSSTSTAGTSRQDRPDLPSSASFHGGQGRLLGRARPGGVAPVRLNQTLGRARSMIQQASSSGLLRRISRTERLRSTANATMSSVSKPPKKPKLEETRPFEFVLMNFGEDHDVENVISGDFIALRGFIQLNATDKEPGIRTKIASAIKTQFPLVEGHDLIFLKATRWKLASVVSAEGFSYDYKQVKLLCGQGAIYVMPKPEFSFMLETTSLENDVECLPASSANFLSTSTVSSANILPQNTNSTLISKENMTVPSALESFEGDTTGPSDGSQSTTSNQDELLNNATGMLDDTSTHSNTSCDKSLDGAIKACIAYCKEKEISEPVEILRQVQKYVITGRKLEPTDESEALDGTTNFILIDRHNVLMTAFDELKAMKTDPRLTLEVSFYGENAQDFGGPRKEFFNMAVGEIKAKYFDKGWREHLAEDYEIVGLILAMSMLQNGILPKFLSGAFLATAFTDNPPENECITNFPKGFQRLGIISILKAFPAFKFLMQPSSSSTLTLKRLLWLLKPTFSEEGNNKRMFENSVYSCFVKYARNVASGQRQGLSLDDLLKFATGACEEPCLGFSIHPCIDFVQSTDGNKWSFIPTASTCTNKIYLPSGSRNAELPNEDELFEIYDFAFTDRYFGKL